MRENVRLFDGRRDYNEERNYYTKMGRWRGIWNSGVLASVTLAQPFRKWWGTSGTGLMPVTFSHEGNFIREYLAVRLGRGDLYEGHRGADANGGVLHRYGCLRKYPTRRASVADHSATFRSMRKEETLCRLAGEGRQEGYKILRKAKYATSPDL